MVTIPFFKNNLLSIDIGFRNIKIVEVEVSRGKEIFIKNFGIASTPKGSIKNGAIQDVRAVTEEIRKVIKDIGVKTKNAKIVMSGTNIISRVFMVENIPGENLDNTVRMTISQSMPIDLDAHKIDYKVLKEIKDDGVPKVKVFVTAVLKYYKELHRYISRVRIKTYIGRYPANSAAKFFNRDIVAAK